jgi:hypothetical protein
LMLHFFSHVFSLFLSCFIWLRDKWEKICNNKMWKKSRGLNTFRRHSTYSHCGDDVVDALTNEARDRCGNCSMLSDELWNIFQAVLAIQHPLHLTTSVLSVSLVLPLWVFACKQEAGG